MATNELQPVTSPFPPGITIIGHMRDNGETFDFRTYRIMRYDSKSGQPKIDWAATALDALESFRAHPLHLEKGKLELWATCMKGNLKELTMPEITEMASHAYFRNNPVAFRNNAAAQSINTKSNTKTNAQIIQRLLDSAPSDWRDQFAGGLSDRRQSGQSVSGNKMTIANALSILGITAGGNRSNDDVTGPYSVPEKVRQNAMKGLMLSHKNNYGAWNFIGIARAIQLATVPGVSARTISRMSAYFGRHVKDQNSSNFGNDANPSRGYMAWLNWGGDEGYEWASGIKSGSSRSNPIAASTVAAVLTAVSVGMDVAKKLWPLVQSKMGVSAEKWLTLSSDQKQAIVKKLFLVGGGIGYALGRSEVRVDKVVAQFDKIATEQSGQKIIGSTIKAGQDVTDLAHTGLSAYQQFSALAKVKP